MPGRKTDVQDCQWIQQLHTYGLLRASFRPDEATCRLRTLVRHRANLVSAGAEHILHMQKALAQMNIQLHQAVSHLTGETGLRMLKAILNGERDPDKLVALRDPQITRSTVAEMSQALKGDWRPELLFVLGQSLRAWEFYQEQMRACDTEIEGQLKQMPSAPPPEAAPPGADPLASPTPRSKAKQSRKRNDPQIDLGPELVRICGMDLTAAHGLRLLTVLTLVSETGVDMSKWRSSKAFTSWLGLNPNNKISGGRVLSSRTRRVVNRVSTALRMGAVGVAETDTWLGSFHRRMRARLGPAGANTATPEKSPPSFIICSKPGIPLSTAISSLMKPVCIGINSRASKNRPKHWVMSLFKPPNRSNWQSSSLEGNEAQINLDFGFRNLAGASSRRLLPASLTAPDCHITTNTSATRFTLRQQDDIEVTGVTVASEDDDACAGGKRQCHV